MITERTGKNNPNYRHGMCKHPAYWVWVDMVRRCTKPRHKAWANYGGRGITVCDRWLSFPLFWEDMGPGYVHGLTLDRVDNDAGYAPANCRWATHKQQADNTRRSLPVDLVALAEETGISYFTLYSRFKRGAPLV